MLHTFDLPQFALSDQLASRQERILLVCDKLIRISLNLNPNQHCQPEELTEIVSSLSPESLIGINGKQQLNVEDVLKTIAEFNNNYLIPNGFALSVNYFSRPEVVFAQISLDSLREQEYLDGKLLHGKMNIIRRTNDTCGMTFGNLALTDPELSKKSSEGLYNLIMSGQVDSQFSVAKLLREDFERQNFGLEDYTEHFGYSRIDHEEIAHAKNNIYTKSLNRKRQNQGVG